MFKNLFNKIKPNSYLNLGDIFAQPLNHEAAKNGFGEYSLPEYFYQVIDFNENGIMVKRYLGIRFENLRSGFSFNPDFMSHEYLIRKFNQGYFMRPNKKHTESFNEIVEAYNKLEQKEK